MSTSLHLSTRFNILQNITYTTPGAIQKPDSIPSHDNIHIMMLIAIAGAAVIIFPVVCLIYKVKTFRMRMQMLQIEQQRGNGYGLPGMVPLDHMNRAEWVRTENNSFRHYSDRHEYLKHSRESDKRDDDYLTPLQIV